MALNQPDVQYFCLSSRSIFVCLVFGFIVCLVSSFRYNGLAALALAGPSGPTGRALRARTQPKPSRDPFPSTGSDIYKAEPTFYQAS